MVGCTASRRSIVRSTPSETAADTSSGAALKPTRRNRWDAKFQEKGELADGRHWLSSGTLPPCGTQAGTVADRTMDHSEVLDRDRGGGSARAKGWKDRATHRMKPKSILQSNQKASSTGRKPAMRVSPKIRPYGDLRARFSRLLPPRIHSGNTPHGWLSGRSDVQPTRSATHTGAWSERPASFSIQARSTRSANRRLPST